MCVAVVSTERCACSWKIAFFVARTEREERQKKNVRLLEVGLTAFQDNFATLLMKFCYTSLIFYLQIALQFPLVTCE
jgi:hypothetical protein